MLYLRTDADGTVYVCKNCAYTENVSHGGSPLCITDTKSFDDSVKYMRYVTPLLLSDPTMPHVSNIACQNESECSRPKDSAHDVVVVKYDYDNLRYMYMCAHCGVAWVTSRSGDVIRAKSQETQ